MKREFTVFLVAFFVRFAAAGVTTLTDLNPESRADATGFASAGETIAAGLIQGQFTYPNIGSTYENWGLFLAPYWLFPGPSGFYGRLGNALLGAFAIYNVYLIAQYYHSHQAGTIAVAPLIFYPSIVAVHSTLLREAIVLFGITTAVRLVIIPPKKSSRWLLYGISFLVLYIAYIQRTDNYIIYTVALGTGLFVYAIESGYLQKRIISVITAFSPVFIIATNPYIQSGIEKLSQTRYIRGGRGSGRGRTDYLITTIPQTVSEMIAFSWVGAAYFLYAPFPWMIETIPDLIVSLEGLISIGFTIAALWGVRTLARQNAAATATLVIGLLLAAVLYGVGTVNYGTGMRHRQMFLWIIFLFGGIGIAEHVQFRGLPKLIQVKTSS